MHTIFPLWMDMVGYMYWGLIEYQKLFNPHENIMM